MQIRQAAIEDLETIQELNQMLFDWEVEEFGVPWNRNWPQEKEQYFRTAITDTEKYLTLVAEQNGKIVGYVISVISNAPSYRTEKLFAEPESMFVLPEFRGSIAAYRLVEKIKEWALSKKADYIKFSTQAGNKRMLSLFRKRGFKDRQVVLEMKL